MGGNLIYIIGASGSGKDTLINYARKYLSKNHNIIFAHRYITRCYKKGEENHIELSPEEFQNRLDKGLFSMNWESYGILYGIGIELTYWLEKNLCVVVNGSRGYLPIAKKKFANLITILINVSPEILQKRMIERKRDNLEEIKRRLARNSKFSYTEKVIKIDNNGLIEESGKHLINTLLGYIK